MTTPPEIPLFPTSSFSDKTAATVSCPPATATGQVQGAAPGQHPAPWCWSRLLPTTLGQASKIRIHTGCWVTPDAKGLKVPCCPLSQPCAGLVSCPPYILPSHNTGTVRTPSKNLPICLWPEFTFVPPHVRFFAKQLGKKHTVWKESPEMGIWSEQGPSCCSRPWILGRWGEEEGSRKQPFSK